MGKQQYVRTGHIVLLRHNEEVSACSRERIEGGGGGKGGSIGKGNNYRGTNYVGPGLLRVKLVLSTRVSRRGMKERTWGG